MKHLILLFSVTFAIAGEWSPNMLSEQLDKSTFSVREQGMAGAGYATGNNAGVIYSNPAQLAFIEGSEIRYSNEPRSETIKVDSGFLFMNNSTPTYTLFRQMILFSAEPKPNKKGRYAMAFTHASCRNNSSLEPQLYVPYYDTIVSSGERFSDNSFDIGIASGYGFAVPSNSESYSHAAGASVDLTVQYRPHFGDKQSGIKQEYRVGYEGIKEINPQAKVSVGFTAGGVVDPIIHAMNHFSVSASVGYSNLLVSRNEKKILSVLAETGVIQDMYPSKSYTGFPNPQLGMELTLLERFAFRSGIRRMKYEMTLTDSLLVPHSKNDLELSYGIGISPFPILTCNLAGRTFLRNENRLDLNQVSLDAHFHWKRKHSDRATK